MINVTSPLSLNKIQPKLEAAESGAPREGFLDKLKEKNYDRETVQKKSSGSPSELAEQSENSVPRADNKVESRPVNGTENQTQPMTPKSAMSVFLAKMQQELGVEPEEVLKAFSELSPEQLLVSPEQSAEALIAKLKLSPVESDKALGLYNEMLAMTAVAGLSQQMIKNNQSAEFKVMTEKDQQLMNLRSSISNMSDKFFMTGHHAPVRHTVDQQSRIAEAYATQLPMAEGQPEFIQKNDNYENANQQQLLGAELAWDQGLASETAAFSETGFDISQTGLTPTDSAEVSELQLKEIFSKNFAPSDIATDIPEDAVLNRSSVSAELPLDIASIETESGFINLGAGLNAESGNDSASAFGSDTSENFDSQNQTPLREGQFTNPVKTESNFAVGMPKATPADVQSNVKEIITQARFLADKGGGEMKVSLNPEGLGELSLKVKMVNGQVNVEMITASDEAKKVLERGLGELKESLAVHKLHLDSVKIEQGKDISQHMDQQQKDLEQGFQQKFLSDFRERNQGFRREMFELGSASQPRSQTRDRANNEIYGSSQKKKSDASRRLDLVA